MSPDILNGSFPLSGHTMLHKILVTTPIIALGLLSAAFAQSTVDVQTVEKADAIMAEIKTADAEELPDLVLQLSKLEQTAGLSGPCQKLLISMQETAALTPPEDDLEDMPEEIQQMVKAQSAGSQQTHNAERSACLDATAQTAPAASQTKQDMAENSFVAPSVKTNAPAKDTRPYHLIKLRERVVSAFEAKDAKGVEALKTLVYVGTQVEEKNTQCRLAKTALMKETTAYIQLLKSTNNTVFNKAAADVQAAALAFESAVAACD